jgi:ribosomal protein S18 acetylase RimI-like enzyme
MTVQVEIAKHVDNDLVVAFQRLIPQLSKSNPAPTKEQLESIVTSDSSHILLAKVDGVIVGSLTLVIFHIPTSIRAWIEDVVVDADARGKGVGEALNKFALAEAKRQGATTVDLTSRPAREEANRLYQRLGFEQRETNVYRYKI